jgi:hypothetical protein
LKCGRRGEESKNDQHKRISVTNVLSQVPETLNGSYRSYSIASSVQAMKGYRWRIRRQITDCKVLKICSSQIKRDLFLTP